MASRTRTRKTDESPKDKPEQIEQIEGEKGEKIPFTPEERVAYFSGKLDYWTAKKGRLIHKPKVARAERRITHYTEKHAEAVAALNS